MLINHNIDIFSPIQELFFLPYMTNTGTKSVIQAESKVSNVKSFNMMTSSCNTARWSGEQILSTRDRTTAQQEASGQPNALNDQITKALKGHMMLSNTPHVLLHLN